MKLILILVPFLLLSCENKEAIEESAPTSPDINNEETKTESLPVPDIKEKEAEEANSPPDSEEPNLPLLEPLPESPTDRPPAAATPPGSSNRPTAAPVPGRPGFCFNPYTNGEVDIRGIPPGSMVRDPQDPNPDHLFRAP